ncbi:MAG: transposase, partial [Bacillota bacterium]|nr:transposase [Bacillota bacterium]
MSQIITYLLVYNQYLIYQIYELSLFIAKHIPLNQLAFEDSNSPKYQKFKVDKVPIIKKFVKQDYNFLLEYYLFKYGKPVKPVQRR